MVAPSTKFQLNLSDAPLSLKFSHTYLFVGDCRASEASKLNLKCEAWPKLVPSSFGCFIVSSSPPSLIDHILTFEFHLRLQLLLGRRWTIISFS